MTYTDLNSGSTVETKPYKGPESYKSEDSDLFFGRDSEAEQVIAKILSSRFTLLHAQSGAGKTSLLNARIIPGLESRGSIAFRVLVQNDPIESIRVTTLQSILPPPQAELLSAQRSIRALLKPSEDVSLGELLDRFDQLQVRDARKPFLTAPIELSLLTKEVALSGIAFSGPVNPMFSRLLRSTIEITQFNEHISAIWGYEGQAKRRGKPITEKTSINELIEDLSDINLVTAYKHLFRQLYVPVPDLWAFLENLVHVYGQNRTRFSLVLILDQFEELFTRFVDPGATMPQTQRGMPDWRLRPEFFSQFERLYLSGLPSEIRMRNGEAAHSQGPLPIRYVVSIRDEYIANLDPLRGFIEDLDTSSYHLGLLGREAAKRAIEEPAKLFQFSYSEKCFETIIRQLTKEDRFIEPSQLQIVCEKLWNERGRDLAKNEGAADAKKLPLIEFQTFDDLGGTKGILKSFFDDFLKGFDKESRLEVLEMLQQLVTTSGTRNIVERGTLLNATFRDCPRRAVLLSKLVDRTITRVERRLNGYFVEITHEFLIGPILEAISNELTRDPEYNRFRWALRALETFGRSEEDPAARRSLTRQELMALHDNRNRIQWTPWSRELMLESAITLGAEKNVLDIWISQLPENVHGLDSSAVVAEILTSGRTQMLRLNELDVIDQERTALDLSREDVELVFRSALSWYRKDNRNDLVYWTKRCAAYEA